jgi:hypothetical protein
MIAGGGVACERAKRLLLLMLLLLLLSPLSQGPSSSKARLDLAGEAPGPGAAAESRLRACRFFSRASLRAMNCSSGSGPEGPRRGSPEGWELLPLPPRARSTDVSRGTWGGGAMSSVGDAARQWRLWVIWVAWDGEAGTVHRMMGDIPCCGVRSGVLHAERGSTAAWRLPMQLLVAPPACSLRLRAPLWQHRRCPSPSRACCWRALECSRLLLELARDKL